jgi:hypothetical protein
VIDFSFKVGGFAQSVTDVDIHAKPQNTGSGSREALSSYWVDSTPQQKGGNINFKFLRFLFSMAG